MPPGRYTAISSGFLHSCARRESGEAVCWGWNTRGAADPPPGHFTAISAGPQGTCAIDAAVMTPEEVQELEQAPDVIICQ